MKKLLFTLTLCLSLSGLIFTSLPASTGSITTLEHGMG
ncbi:hypothetical protein QE450_003545 [Paenibacillus sp. SORGH_AS306]|nr:hypothetical protein [Paenibacillus sp. SORGH_AS_0306]MDR6108403.1 hypothetical protein [Paenibacillus sp. SORGH_AS_0338]